MTISFFKLQVAGNDFVLIDREREGQGPLPEDSAALGELARLMLDRRCGIGGRGCIFLQTAAAGGTREPTVTLRVFASDGSELHSGRDALLCAARWAFDSGRAAGNKVSLRRGGQVLSLTAVDSKSFMLEVPVPPSKRLALIVDGRQASAYETDLDEPCLVAVAAPAGPGPKRIRMALAAMGAGTLVVMVRSHGTDILRFAAPERADRLNTAIAAMGAAIAHGRLKNEAVAEWRGRGGAISYADFGSGVGTPLAATGPVTLIDRGRFWLDWHPEGYVRVAGMAEYAFEGSFDY